MSKAYVSGVGMTTFGKHVERGLGDLAAEAVRAALDDAGLDAGAIGSVFFANAVAGMATGQEAIRGEVYLNDAGLRGKPIINVENACASGSTAVHLARLAVQAGECDVALAVGVEKMNYPDRAPVFKTMLSGVDLEQLDAVRAAVGSRPPDDGPDPLFMDIYAHSARGYLARVGASTTDLAQVVVKNHEHARHNHRAQYRDAVTVPDVLSSRMIKEPLTLLMCSPFTDGAAAVVVTQQATAGVAIRSSVVLSGGAGDDEHAVTGAASQAYERADIGPQDVDVAELHDATASQELILCEQAGLCAEGDAPRMLRNGDTSLGGRLPVNTSGGLLTKGHPVGATGCAQVVELVEQLRGASGARQVEGARIGLAVNAGGYLPPDPAAVAVTVLEGRS